MLVLGRRKSRGEPNEEGLGESSCPARSSWGGRTLAPPPRRRHMPSAGVQPRLGHGMEALYIVAVPIYHQNIPAPVTRCQDLGPGLVVCTLRRREPAAPHRSVSAQPVRLVGEFLPLPLVRFWPLASRTRQLRRPLGRKFCSGSRSISGPHVYSRQGSFQVGAISCWHRTFSPWQTVPCPLWTRD